MKIVWLAPYNIHLEPQIRALQLMHDVRIVWYDTFGPLIDRVILDSAHKINPDLIVCTGQNGGLYPGLDTLLKLRGKWPLVFIVHDGSDKTWRPLLETYKAYDVFSVIVNIDGNDSWPKREVDFTALTPTCQEFYL